MEIESVTYQTLNGARINWLVIFNARRESGTGRPLHGSLRRLADRHLGILKAGGRIAMEPQYPQERRRLSCRIHKPRCC